MYNISTVIFDLGRVLVRISTDGEKFGGLMRAMGIEPSEAFDRFWYASEVRMHMTGEMDPVEFFHAARDRFGLKYTYEDFIDAWCDLFQPMPGMEALFHRVAERYRVGILSDTDPLHWVYIRNMMPWLSAVEKPTLSYNVGYLKPHPKMYEAAAENSEAKKECCLFIDDLIANVDGARYSGMPALLFHDAERLARDLTGLRLI